MSLTAETITDEQIKAIRDAACECRPYPPIESPEEHAVQHDCDVWVFDMCVVALEAHGEEGHVARSNCATFVNDVLTEDESSAYWRALQPKP